MKIGIVSTGIVYDYCINAIIEQYQNLDKNKYTIIISTWNYIDINLIEQLKSNGFIVIQNDFPDNLLKTSVNYQHFSYLCGVEYAKNIDISHILRVRSDVITNMQSLLKIYEDIYDNKPIFITYIRHDCGYLIDYATFFDINFYNNFEFTYQKNGDNRFPEKYLQETYFGSSDWIILKPLVTLSITKLLENNVDFVFLKPDYVQYGKQIERYKKYHLCEC